MANSKVRNPLFDHHGRGMRKMSLAQKLNKVTGGLNLVLRQDNSDHRTSSRAITAKDTTFSIHCSDGELHTSTMNSTDKQAISRTSERTEVTSDAAELSKRGFSKLVKAASVPGRGCVTRYVAKGKTV